MKIERVVYIARKIAYVFAFLAFFCVPVSGGRDWAPMYVMYIGGWGTSRFLVIISRICMTYVLYRLYHIVFNNDKKNGPIVDYWVFGVTSLSIMLLALEMYPAEMLTFSAIIIAIAILCICDALTLRWLAKRDRQVANRERTS